MDRQLVFSKNGNVYLNTSMTQRAFSKSKLAQHLEERGWIAEKDGSRWTFRPWSFIGTKSAEDEDAVLLEGAAFSSLSLKAFFDEHDKAKQVLAGALVCTAIEAAQEQDIKLKDVGAGGILISADFTRVLFLPQELFETAMQCAGTEDYSKWEGQYVNKTLAKNAALQFTQAVIAYRLLADDLPFPETDSDKREEDYRDINFIPLKDRIWALDEGLAAFIDNALCRKPATKGKNLDAQITRIIQESKAQEGGLSDKRAGMRFPLVAFYRELGLTDDGNIPQDGQLKAVIHKARVSQEQFEETAKQHQQHFQRSLGRKRWLRRHRTALSIGGAVAAVLIILSAILIQGNMQQPTTRGLTSFQTVEMFYSAINNLDVMSVKQSSQGKDFSNVENIISTFYVSSKSRSVYNYKDKTVTPAEWLNFNYDGSYNIYGLSQFVINESKGNLYFSGPAKKDFLEPITEEDGNVIKEGAEKKLRTSYYLIYNEGPETLTVMQQEDELTLSFKKRRWIITKMFQHDAVPLSVDYQSFQKDYKACFTQVENGEEQYESAQEKAGKVVIPGVNLLRQKYRWLPSNSEILEAADKIQQENRF